jgi:glycosyltransferase involved in cell wall biosynthesis
MTQSSALADRSVVWAVPDRDTTGDHGPRWMDQAVSALRSVGARVSVQPVDTGGQPAGLPEALMDAEVVLATSMSVGRFLATSGVSRRQLWTFVQDAPGEPLDVTGTQEDDLRNAVATSRKVVVFDEEARSTVESMVWDAAMNVLVFPTAGSGPLPRFRASADGPVALVINLDLTGPLGLAAVRKHASRTRAERDPRPVFLVCGPEIQARLRVDPVYREFAAVPGARTVASDEEALATALHGVRPVGFLPRAEYGEDHRVSAARIWFEECGIELFAQHGALPALPQFADIARWDSPTLTDDLAVLTEGRVPTRVGNGLPGELSRMFEPFLPDYGTVARRPGKLKVLLVGADFKFAGDIVEALALREDIDLRVDRWRYNAVPQPEESRPLLEWAEVILCEFASINAVWYSSNVRPDQRLILHLHGYELRQPHIHDVEISAVEKVVFASEFYRRTALEVTGWPPERTAVIANSVQSADLARTKLPDARFHLGLAGFIPELKRPDRALDVIEALLERDDRYTLHLRGHLPWNYPYVWKNLVRRDAYLALFERLRHNPSLRQAVVFDPFGPDMGNWFRGIGWTLSTSTRETFHLAPAEGMASGAVPLVWRREGSDEIFPRHWNVDTASEAAELIHGVSADPARFDELSLEAAFFAQAYDAGRVVAQWLDLVLGDAGTPPTAPGPSQERNPVEVPQSPAQREKWAEIGSLVSMDRLVQAQELLMEDLPWRHADSQRRVAGEVFGIPALRQRVHHLFGPRAHEPLRGLGRGTVVVCAPGLDPGSLTRHVADEVVSTVRLTEAWDNANEAFDAWVDLITRKALMADAGTFYAMGDEVTALACAVAAHRLGVSSVWDMAGDTATADRLAAAVRDPYRATDRGVLALMAGRQSRQADDAVAEVLERRAPIEARVHRPLLRRTPQVGLIGTELDVSSTMRPLDGITLERDIWQARIRRGLDALLISGDAARSSDWTAREGSETVLHRVMTEARRYNVPIGFIDDHAASLEPVLPVARRADAVLAPGAEDVARLHDRRLVSSQVATALPVDQPVGDSTAQDGELQSTSLLSRPEALELVVRMLRINQGDRHPVTGRVGD